MKQLRMSVLGLVVMALLCGAGTQAREQDGPIADLAVGDERPTAGFLEPWRSKSDSSLVGRANELVGREDPLFDSVCERAMVLEQGAVRNGLTCLPTITNGLREPARMFPPRAAPVLSPPTRPGRPSAESRL